LPENIATQQYDDLRNRNVELVLGRPSVTTNEANLVTETLFHEPNVVAAGPESAWARRRNLKLADLMGEPWVLAQPGSLAQSIQDQAFRNSGLEPPTATVMTASLHFYKRLIETARWLGLAPGSAMLFGGKGMRIRALPVETLPQPAPVDFTT
jgi:DNA-binding transcriptional LysR family regulator